MCRSAKGRKSRRQPISSRKWRNGCAESVRWAPSLPISSRLLGNDGMVPDFLTIAEAAALIGKRELSPVELTESRLARIERFDDRLHSFIRVLREPALAAARAAEAEIMAGNYRGPLHGIPIGLKDIYETKGVPTTGHSKVLIDHVPEQDATSVRRLREAGAIIMGKLATHEFALGGPSFDLPWPPARNPWEHQPLYRRLVERHRRGGRGRPRARRHRQRYRRLDPWPRRLLRARRHQADLRPHQPDGDPAAGVFP